MSSIDLWNRNRISSSKELTDVVNEIGFLPLFQNEIPGFSVVEMAGSDYLWTGDEILDPWQWRVILAREGNVSFGKMFAKKAGFISREWYPSFANYRRDGYDFDSRYEDGLASHMDKDILSLIEEGKELSSFELKAQICGKSKKGTGFDTALLRLQMQTYLTITDYRRKRTKQGEEYGWAAAVFATPETIFGADFVQSEYKLEPMESKAKIMERLARITPNAGQKEMERLIK